MLGKHGRSLEQQQHGFPEQLLNARHCAKCLRCIILILTSPPRSIIIPFFKMKKQSLKENQKVARLVTELGFEPRSVRL